MDYLAAGALMLGMDSVYLGLIKGQWSKMISTIQKGPLNVRLVYAAAVYMLMLFGLFYFIILPRRSVYDAALLGIVVYGVFDMTNMAIFKEYSLMLAVTDMLWGGLLFASVTYIVQLLFKNRK
jgi:uncharacterized membrane protein